MNLYYNKEHEWINVEDNSIQVGVSSYAQGQLGDVVFVELPSVGKTIFVGDPLVVIESVKAAAEVNAPIAGTVEVVNEELSNTPELINEDPLGKGWLLKIVPSDEIDLSQWMNQEAYDKYLLELS